MKKRRPSQLDGILVLNKPKGPTSNSCVEEIKRRFRQKKVGHGGTLDPVASGLLIILLGQGTKLAPYIMEGKKCYRGILELGVETDTYDLTGEEISRRDVRDVNREEIIEGIEEWKTYTEQEVPPYSAAKYKGRPFYSLARAGKHPPKRMKKISIDHCEVLNINLPFVEFRVRCCKGTYIRALAHSLGRRIGVGAVLKDLVREEIFPFSLKDAVDMELILSKRDLFFEKVLPLEKSLPHWKKVMVDELIAQKIRNGMQIRVKDLPGVEVEGEGDRFVFLDEYAKALSLMEVREKGGTLVFSILRGLWKRTHQV